MTYMTSTGMTASDSAASTEFQSVTYCPMNCCTPRVTVLVRSDGARISGNHRSFQAGIMVNTATVAMAGRIRGRITWKKMANSPTPSQRAASFSSRGTWRTNSDRIITASGRPCAVYTSTSAVKVLIRSSRTTSSRMDTVPRRMGIMMPSARYRVSRRLPVNVYSDKAQAAMAPNSTISSSDSRVTNRLLPKYSRKSELASTL